MEMVMEKGKLQLDFHLVQPTPGLLEMFLCRSRLQVVPSKKKNADTK